MSIFPNFTTELDSKGNFLAESLFDLFVYLLIGFCHFVP